MFLKAGKGSVFCVLLFGLALTGTLKAQEEEAHFIVTGTTYQELCSETEPDSFESGLQMGQQGRKTILPQTKILVLKGEEVVWTTRSDQWGQYRLEEMTPGTYEFLAYHESNELCGRENLTIETGSKDRQQLNLELELGEATFKERFAEKWDDSNVAVVEDIAAKTMRAQNAWNADTYSTMTPFNEHSTYDVLPMRHGFERHRYYGFSGAGHHWAALLGIGGLTAGIVALAVEDTEPVTPYR